MCPYTGAWLMHETFGFQFSAFFIPATQYIGGNVNVAMGCAEIYMRDNAEQEASVFNWKGNGGDLRDRATHHSPWLSLDAVWWDGFLH